MHRSSGRPTQSTTTSSSGTNNTMSKPITPQQGARCPSQSHVTARAAAGAAALGPRIQLLSAAAVTAGAAKSCDVPICTSGPTCQVSLFTQHREAATVASMYV
jgi:hypothetical protein